MPGGGYPPGDGSRRGLRAETRLRAMMAPTPVNPMGAREGGRETAAGPAVDVGSVTVTLPEARQLWWFLDGAMMAPDIRRHLWRSWGFCPRHAWLHAVVELQVRGGIPFATSILYEELARRAARTTRGAPGLPWGVALGRLRARASCLTCDYVALAADDRAGRDLLPRTNRLDRVRERLRATRPAWQARSCPLCLGGTGPVCRQHLLLGAHPSPALSRELERLADRLDAFVRSMTWRGRPVDALGQASWVEALGWFAGWDYPRKLLGLGGTSETGAQRRIGARP